MNCKRDPNVEKKIHFIKKPKQNKTMIWPGTADLLLKMLNAYSPCFADAVCDTSGLTAHTVHAVG